MDPKGLGPERVKYRGPPVDERGRVRKYPLPIGQAESLLALSQEFTFFTPAVLYLHARFTDAPLFDMMWELQRDVRIYYRKFDRPVFAGLEAPSNGDPGWNHALLAVRPDDWPILSDFVCSLAWHLRDARAVYNFGEQDLVVVDPLALERTGFYHRGLPVLPVTAFGLTGNTGRLAFRVSPDPFAGAPALCRLPPTPEMVRFAEAYYAGANPVAARDLARHRERVAKALEDQDDRAPGRQPRHPN